MKNFMDRLSRVLGPRKITPWGLALGLSGSTITSMAQGTPPKADKLAVIRRAELVNLNWLLDGSGPPFQVTSFDAAEELVQAVAAHLEDQPWQVDLLVEEGPFCTVLLSILAGHEDDETSAPAYKIREMLHGPISEALSQRIIEHAGGLGLYRQRVIDHDLMRRIGRGEVGPYELLGDDQAPGLLGVVPSLNDPQVVAEKVARYSSQGTLQRAQALVRGLIETIEAQLEDRGISLPSDKKAQLVALLMDRGMNDVGWQPDSENVLKMLLLASQSDEGVDRKASGDAERVYVRLRMGRALHERLKQEATNNRRSLNEEAVHRLESSLGAKRRSSKSDYSVTDGERSLLDKLRRLQGQDAGTAAAVIDALAAKASADE